MGCECHYDGPMPSFYEQTRRKCRKPAMCCECGQTINKGDVYVYVVGVWEGDFDTFKTCELCWDLRKRCDFQCVVLGGIAEDVSQRLDTDIEIEAFKKRRGWFDDIALPDQEIVDL